MGNTDGSSAENYNYSSVKKDCFAYGTFNNMCSVLEETVCRYKECKFYKTKREFEKGRKKYE